MSISQACGTSVVPLLSRVLLGAVFLTIGYNDCFRQRTFSVADGQRLAAVGVDTAERPIVVAHVAFIRPLEIQDPEEAAQDPVRETVEEATEAVEEAVDDMTEAAGEALQDAAEAVDETVDEVVEGASDQIDEIVDAAAAPDGEAIDAGATVEALGLHRYTLAADRAGWNAPSWLPRRLAAAIAIGELVGGGLLLIGLLTRLAGLVLTAASGLSFYFGSYPQVAETITAWQPLEFGLDEVAFARAGFYLAMTIMAFGLFLTGAGAFSIDRALFGGPGKQQVDDG